VPALLSGYEVPQEMLLRTTVLARTARFSAVAFRPSTEEVPNMKTSLAGVKGGDSRRDKERS